MIKILTGNDPDSIIMTLTQLKQRYEETNNPIYPMFAYRYCFERNAEPPHWVMEFVAISFHDYLTNCANKTLDECFQVKTTNGKTTPMKMFLLDERDDMIMGEMFKLVEYLGLSMEAAAHMVKEKLSEADWNKTLVDLSELSEGSIKDMYRKRYRKSWLNAKESDPESETYFSLEKRIKFLDTFPQHTIPHGLKESLSVPRHQ